MRVTTVLLGVVLSMAQLPGLARSVRADETGNKAFVSNKCSRCHAVDAQGIEATTKSKRNQAPDLSEVGQDRDAEWLAQYIRREIQSKDKDHPIAWKGSDEDIEAIANWLTSIE